MIQIQNTIVSFDLFEKHFTCKLDACMGACCVEGDSGAPLTKEEADSIAENYPAFKEYLDPKYQAIIQEKGFTVVDADGDLVTPLYNKRECVYTMQSEAGITFCAIEKSFLEGNSSFRKPVSCHLFPIRITKHATFDAVNYQALDICKPGRLCGAQSKMELYRFLREPLIRKYGEEWYAELEMVAEELKDYRR
jgi:hypothetical protein